jgi:hypothetical protein
MSAVAVHGSPMNGNTASQRLLPIRGLPLMQDATLCRLAGFCLLAVDIMTAYLAWAMKLPVWIMLPHVDECLIVLIRLGIQKPDC